MNICTVWHDDYPWDVRMEKICLSCILVGHKVDIVARNKGGRAQRETLPEGQVHRIKPFEWVGRKVNSALMFPAFFNPRWIALIARTAREERADLILVRDLPLALSAILVARRLNLPVVLDMAENYPAMMKALWETGVARPRDWLIRNPRVVSWVEREVLRRVDHTFVVVEESEQRLVNLGVSASKVTLVSNTPAPARAGTRKEHHEPTREHPVRLVYLGIIERHRGLEVVLQGVAQAQRNGLPVHLTVIGDGVGRRELESFSRDLGMVSDGISFLGFLPNPRALAVVGECDVGLVPHLPLESWQTTIPNKLFDYMATGLAVLSSDSVPCARIIRETRCGVIYEQSPDAFVSALTGLLPSATRQAMSSGGQNAVRAKYNWALDEHRMLGVLRAIVDKRA